MNKIYLASSWRNSHIDTVRDALRIGGHDVYDFREADAFNWNQIDPEYDGITPISVNKFSELLDHDLARKGHERDVTHLMDADICVLILPCNKSAHMELGMAIMRGKFTIVYTPFDLQPELMYASVNHVTGSLVELQELAETNVYTERPREVSS